MDVKSLPKWLTLIDERNKPIYGTSRIFTNENLLIHHLRITKYYKIRISVKPNIHDDDNEVIIYEGFNTLNL